MVELDLLPPPSRAATARGCVPYTNFYLCNGAVIVPVSDQPDRRRGAGRASRRCFPDREVVAVPGAVLAMGGGGVHCITQQVPAAG